MAKTVRSLFGGIRALRAWANEQALRAEVARQTQEMSQPRRARNGRDLIAVGAALATLASQGAAQTFNTAAQKITTEGNALANEITTVLAVLAVIAFLIGIGMLMFRQRGAWIALASAVGSLFLIPVTKALPALAK